MPKANTDITIVPEVYRNLVLQVIERAKADLLAGNSVPSVYFLGKLKEGTIDMAPIDTCSPEAKDASARAARALAHYLEADFVLMLSEAWMLPAHKQNKAQAILDKYGSVSAYPGKVDVAWFSLETRQGVFSATARILAVPPSKKRRKFGPIEWVKADLVEGRLAGILPEATLH